MAIKKERVYIDTSVTGLVSLVQHNLGGVPDLFITDYDTGVQKYVSLMDARIAEIKVIDKDTTQLSFASLFTGYVEFLFVEVDKPNDHDRLIELESKYFEQLNLIEDKVSKSQWIQMNTLFSSQIETLQNQIIDLQSQINLLKADVEAL